MLIQQLIILHLILKTTVNEPGNFGPRQLQILNLM